MTFPVWMLLAFAVWTMGVLLFTIGIYRWSRILTGRAQIKEFRGDSGDAEGWYLRAMRAHANCVENLPIFGAVVFALYVSGISSEAVNLLAGIVLVARIAQTITHVAFIQTNAVAFFRFIFFFAQLVCFISLAAIVAVHAL
jgi:uncharacterized MAPEG superfamily protein